MDKKGELVTTDLEKTEVRNNFFAPVFSQASHVSYFPEQEDEGWGSKVPPTVSKE